MDVKTPTIWFASNINPSFISYFYTLFAKDRLDIPEGGIISVIQVYSCNFIMESKKYQKYIKNGR